jgi:hypothetical protein
MSSIQEAQELANQRSPIDWVDTGDGFSTVAGPEVYGVDIVQQLDGQGGLGFSF